MLYLPGGTSIPTRIHGAFVDDHEVLKVVNYLKQSVNPTTLRKFCPVPASEAGEGEEPFCMIRQFGW